MAASIPHASSRHGCSQSLAVKQKPREQWLKRGGSGPRSASRKSGASSASGPRKIWSGFGTSPTGRATLQIEFEDCLLDTDRRELRRGRELVSLEPQGFEGLILLVENYETVVTKDCLLALVLVCRMGF